MLLTMPSSRLKSGGELPGGWETASPEVRFMASDARFRDVVSVLRRHGLAPLAAETKAAKVCATLWSREWKRCLLPVVSRWADMWKKQNFGSLEGFEPSLVARLWVPTMKQFNVSGAEMQRLFVEMKREKEPK